jgi:hypothetical protein
MTLLIIDIKHENDQTGYSKKDRKGFVPESEGLRIMITLSSPSPQLERGLLNPAGKWVMI